MSPELSWWKEGCLSLGRFCTNNTAQPALPALWPQTPASALFGAAPDDGRHPLPVGGDLCPRAHSGGPSQPCNPGLPPHTAWPRPPCATGGGDGRPQPSLGGGTEELKPGPGGRKPAAFLLRCPQPPLGISGQRWPRGSHTRGLGI